MTGAEKAQLIKLLAEVGQACSEYQNKVLRNLTYTRISCDEMWAFYHAKEKNVPDDKKGKFGYGDVYTWTALDADAKLVLSRFMARRDAKFLSSNARFQASKGRFSRSIKILYHEKYMFDLSFNFDIIETGREERQEEQRYDESSIIRRKTGVPRGRGA